MDPQQAVQQALQTAGSHTQNALQLLQQETFSEDHFKTVSFRLTQAKQTLSPTRGTKGRKKFPAQEHLSSSLLSLQIALTSMQTVQCRLKTLSSSNSSTAQNITAEHLKLHDHYLSEYRNLNKLLITVDAELSSYQGEDKNIFAAELQEKKHLAKTLQNQMIAFTSEISRHFQSLLEVDLSTTPDFGLTICSQAIHFYTGTSKQFTDSSLPMLLMQFQTKIAQVATLLKEEFKKKTTGMVTSSKHPSSLTTAIAILSGIGDYLVKNPNAFFPEKEINSYALARSMYNYASMLGSKDAAARVKALDRKMERLRKMNSQILNRRGIDLSQEQLQFKDSQEEQEENTSTSSTEGKSASEEEPHVYLAHHHSKRKLFYRAINEFSEEIDGENLYTFSDFLLKLYNFYSQYKLATLLEDADTDDEGDQDVPTLSAADQAFCNDYLIKRAAKLGHPAALASLTNRATTTPTASLPERSTSLLQATLSKKASTAHREKSGASEETPPKTALKRTAAQEEEKAAAQQSTSVAMHKKQRTVRFLDAQAAAEGDEITSSHHASSEGKCSTTLKSAFKYSLAPQ